MKHLILFSTFLFALKPAFSCSCGPYNDNFYDHVTGETEAGVMRVDSIYTTLDTVNQIFTDHALFTLVKGFNFAEEQDGNTLFLFNDGFGCMIDFSAFQQGDTIVAALEKSDSLYFIPFASAGGCGRHYLQISGGMNGGQTLLQIEQQVKAIIATGISESGYLGDLGIVPNPCTKYISFSRSLNAPVSIEIVNSLGQVVQKEQYIPQAKTIDVSGLQSGIYFITLVVKNEKRTFKLLKE